MDEPRTNWTKRLFWFVALYVGGAAGAATLAYALRALLPLR